MGKFVRHLKKTKNVISILEMEYELTNKSDHLGFVDYKYFL